MMAKCPHCQGDYTPHLALRYCPWCHGRLDRLDEDAPFPWVTIGVTVLGVVFFLGGVFVRCSTGSL
jgi:hypothetical protein